MFHANPPLEQAEEAHARQSRNRRFRNQLAQPSPWVNFALIFLGEDLLRRLLSRLVNRPVSQRGGKKKTQSHSRPIPTSLERFFVNYSYINPWFIRIFAGCNLTHSISSNSSFDSLRLRWTFPSFLQISLWKVGLKPGSPQSFRPFMIFFSWLRCFLPFLPCLFFPSQYRPSLSSFPSYFNHFLPRQDPGTNILTWRNFT